MARWTPRPTVSWPWCTSWGEGDTTMEASCSRAMTGSSMAMRRVARARSASRSMSSGGSKNTGTKPARRAASSASARRRSQCPENPRLATTLTTVHPRSSRWRSAPGQPTASSSGWGATWTTVGATTLQVRRPVALFPHAAIGALGPARAGRAGGGPGCGPGRHGAGHARRHAVAVGGRPAGEDRRVRVGALQLHACLDERERGLRRSDRGQRRDRLPVGHRARHRGRPPDPVHVRPRRSRASASGRRPSWSTSGSARPCTNRSSRRGSPCFPG